MLVLNFGWGESVYCIYGRIRKIVYRNCCYNICVSINNCISIVRDV